MNIKLTNAGVPAQCDVYSSDTHAFDMLYPKRNESKTAAKRFTEYFEKNLNLLYDAFDAEDIPASPAYSTEPMPGTVNDMKEV